MRSLPFSIKAPGNYVPGKTPVEVMIVELHSPGHDSNKCTAVEYHQAVFDGLKIATDRVIVVALEVHPVRAIFVD